MSFTKIRLPELLILWVVSISIAAILELACSQFQAGWALLQGSLLMTVTLVSWNYGVGPLRFELKDARLGWDLLLILLLATIFRAPPYNHLLSGQDQGVYVATASHYERTGSPFFTDELNLRAAQTGVKDQYEKLNSGELTFHKKGKYEGVLFAGLFIADRSVGKCVPQFYPLHPLWMAIFGTTLGESNRVGSLILFSLLSVLFFFLLATELSGGDRWAGRFAAVFLAVNPLHAFFSKFPVAEVVSLSFLLAAFYFMLKFYNGSRTREASGLDLVLATGSMLCVFLTRISGFLYLPFFLIAAASLLLSPSRQGRRPLLMCILAIFATFAASLLYGYLYSYPYTVEIYGSILGNLIFGRSRAILSAAAALFFISGGIILARLSPTRRKKIGLHLTRASAALPLLIFGVFIWAMSRVYFLGFTEFYRPASDLVAWGAVHQGWKSFPFTSFFALAAYLSPVGLILCLFALWHFRKPTRPPQITYMLLFMLWAWTYGIGMQGILVYHYYYGRYLLSETIPSGILLVALLLAEWNKITKKKIVVWSSSAMIILFSIYFSAQQFKGNVGDGSSAAFEQVRRLVGKNDILLFDRSGIWFGDGIRNTLVANFGLNILDMHPMREGQTLDTLLGIFRPLIQTYGSTLYMAQNPQSRPGFQYLKRIDFRHGMFEWAHGIPTRFEYLSTPLYVYRVNLADLK